MHDRARQSEVIIHSSSSCGLVAGDKTVACCASKGRAVLLRKAMAIDHGPARHSRKLDLPRRRGYAVE